MCSLQPYLSIQSDCSAKIVSLLLFRPIISIILMENYSQFLIHKAKLPSSKEKITNLKKSMNLLGNIIFYQEIKPLSGVSHGQIPSTEELLALELLKKKQQFFRNKTPNGKKSPHIIFIKPPLIVLNGQFLALNSILEAVMEKYLFFNQLEKHGKHQYFPQTKVLSLPLHYNLSLSVILFLKIIFTLELLR